MEVIIRDGYITDAETVKTIAFSSMDSFGIESDPDGLDFEIGHFGEDYPGSIFQIVACKDNIVIGSLILKEKYQNSAKLTGFYTNTKYRGFGIGKQLLQEALNRAKNKALAGIYLDTWHEMKAAIYLYEKFGWIRIKDPPIGSGAQRSYYLNLKTLK